MKKIFVSLAVLSSVLILCLSSCSKKEEVKTEKKETEEKVKVIVEESEPEIIE